MASKKGNVNRIRKSPVFGVDKMMEMDLNASEDGDWLVVNGGTDSRAGNCKRISRDSAPKSLHHPAVMGRMPDNSYETLHNLQKTSAGLGRVVAGGMKPPLATCINKTNKAVMGRSVHLPLPLNGWSSEPRGSLDGIGSGNGGCISRPAIHVNREDNFEEYGSSDDMGGFKGIGAAKDGCNSRSVTCVLIDSDDDENDEVTWSEYEYDSTFNDNSDHDTNAERKGVTSDVAPRTWWWGHHGQVPKSSVPKDFFPSPSDVAQFPFAKCGQRTSGRGMPHPSVQSQAPLGLRRNCPDGSMKERCSNDKSKDFTLKNPYNVGKTCEIGFSGDGMGKMKGVARGNGSQQIQNRNHGPARAGPPLRPCSNIAPLSISHGHIRPAADQDMKQQIMLGYRKMTGKASIHPSNPKHCLNSAARTGPFNVKATSDAEKMEAFLKSTVLDDSETDMSDDNLPEVPRKVEIYKQKCPENAYSISNTRLDDGESLTKLPHGGYSRSGAACQVSAKNGGHRRAYSNANSFDTDSYEDSNYDDDDQELACRYQSKSANDEKCSLTAEKSCRYKSAKSEDKTEGDINRITKLQKEENERKDQKMEGNCESNRGTTLPTEKNVVKETCCTHPMNGISEAKDASEHQQLQIKLVSQQSYDYTSLFEDFKHRLGVRGKEVANIIKVHVGQKHENDTCAAERDSLLKIHEEKLNMKKRHWGEEQELEKRFAAALSLLMEKQAASDSDRDASSKL